ncbi:MAG: 30S ribosomal protein S7 [Candidatus Shapirobacteria bacterium]|jgi:small subunit ribosomal protein S7
MSRKGPIKPREITPDPIYQSVLVQKIINASLIGGKKISAQKQVYQALEILKKENPKDEVATLVDQALENIRPKIEVRPRRIGGAVYQVPTPVRRHRQDSLAVRWLIANSRKLPNKQFHSFGLKLANELTLALKSEGTSVAKRAEIERMADANKAFAHLRW